MCSADLRCKIISFMIRSSPGLTKVGLLSALQLHCVTSTLPQVATVRSQDNMNHSTILTDKVEIGAQRSIQSTSVRCEEIGDCGVILGRRCSKDSEAIPVESACTSSPTRRRPQGVGEERPSVDSSMCFVSKSSSTTDTDEHSYFYFWKDPPADQLFRPFNWTVPRGNIRHSTVTD